MSDLLSLLEDMEKSLDDGNRLEFFTHFYQVKNLKAQPVSDSIVAQFKNVLVKSIKQFKKDNSFNTVVSSVISLSYGLIPADRLDADLLKIFTECMELQDTRIKANALTAICEFDPGSELFKEHINSKFNRIAAEALFAESKKGLTPAIFEKLKEFLGSSNPFFVASGVYVAGQIIDHHKGSPIFKSNDFKEDFDFLFKKIQIFSNHPHEMIRKQALQVKARVDNMK